MSLGIQDLPCRVEDGVEDGVVDDGDLSVTSSSNKHAYSGR